MFRFAKEADKGKQNSSRARKTGTEVSKDQKPGNMYMFRPQHMTGLRLVRDLCGARLQGDSVGSTEIKFVPGRLREGEFSADTKTAG